jgi:hypothetical protein
MEYLTKYSDAFFKANAGEEWFQDRYNPVNLMRHKNAGMNWAKTESLRFKEKVLLNPSKCMLAMSLDPPKKTSFVGSNLEDQEAAVSEDVKNDSNGKENHEVDEKAVIRNEHDHNQEENDLNDHVETDSKPDEELIQLNKQTSEDSSVNAKKNSAGNPRNAGGVLDCWGVENAETAAIGTYFLMFRYCPLLIIIISFRIRSKYFWAYESSDICDWNTCQLPERRFCRRDFRQIKICNLKFIFNFSSSCKTNC